MEVFTIFFDSLNFGNFNCRSAGIIIDVHQLIMEVLPGLHKITIFYDFKGYTHHTYSTNTHTLSFNALAGHTYQIHTNLCDVQGEANIVQKKGKANSNRDWQALIIDVTDPEHEILIVSSDPSDTKCR